MTKICYNSLTVKKIAQRTKDHGDNIPILKQYIFLTEQTKLRKIYQQIIKKTDNFR